MKKLFFLLSTLATGGMTIAQQTGSFNATITFNESSRILSHYVPADYDATQSYRLVIGLHGMGDNSTNYRNALVNGLSFATAFPNTILICPDGGNDQGRDFYTPVGDEAIIREAILHATANYHIDTSAIILQGFSLGGRSALRYGLDNPEQFSALLLNTPAIQGVKEANNASLFTYNYANASRLPIFITLGNDDPLYQEPINVTMTYLVAHNAKVAYKKFKGGHTVPDFRNYPYSGFFNQPHSSGIDAGIYKVTAPVRTCDGSITATILLQNTGNDVLQTIKLAYGIGNNKDTFTWQGDLARYEHVELSLPVYQAGKVTMNSYDFEVALVSLNQNIEDLFPDFNSATKSVHIMNNILSLPFEERFESEADLEKWALNSSGDYLLPFSYFEEDGALFSFNSIFIFDNAGTREEVLSPELDLSGHSSVYLHFNVDYNYTQYTANVVGVDAVFADTLEVWASQDCGQTYTPLFKKAGADLSGQDAPIFNPLDIANLLPDVDRNRYRSFSIDVSSFAGEDKVHFKFSYLSGLGGYIYLDDIVVNNDPTSVNRVHASRSGMRLYPNPSSEQLHISLDNEAIQQIQVYNMLGQLVYETEGNNRQQQSIEVGSLSKGTYLINVSTKDRRVQKKFIVQ